MSASDPRTGLRQAAGDGGFDLREAVGGPRGIVDGALPSVLFVVVYTVAQELRPALWTALGTAALLVVVRVVLRQTVQPAVSGLLGVAVCAFVVSRTGRAEDFYLPGLLVNIAYAAAYAVSIAVRWPLLGVIVGPLRGEGFAWRDDPARLRAYSRASWIWVVMFLLRVAVQGPLYAAGMVAALGVARLVMGIPLFAVAVWLSWLILRRAPAAPAAEGRA